MRRDFDFDKKKKTDLEYIMAQGVEQIVGHDADGVDTRSGTQYHTRSAEPDSAVIHRVKNGHIQLPRVQIRF